MEITIESWVIPTLVTAMAIIIALVAAPKDGMAAGVYFLFFLLLASIASLIAWLIWALI